MSREWHSRLGKETDAVIAADVGITVHAVCRARRARGIPSAMGRFGREKSLSEVAKDRDAVRGIYWASKTDKEEPPAGTIRSEIVTPSSHSGVSTCTFADDCRCQWCRDTRKPSFNFS